MEESVTFLKGTDQDELSLHGTECASLVFLTGGPLIGMVGVYNVNDAPQNVASSPVQLTVGLNTTLLLSVSRQNSSNTHVFTARLVGGSGVGLPDRTLTLELNDTQHEYNATTNNLGNATWTLQLSPQANDSATTYNIIVSFAGDVPVKTAAAYLTTPNGTSYAVCTTTQYNSLEVILSRKSPRHSVDSCLGLCVRESVR